jgi:hypothetical protein
LALNFSCYTSLDIHQIRHNIEILKKDYASYFDSDFMTFFSEKECSQPMKEMALDFNFIANYFFSVRVNHKEKIDRIENVVNILKMVFGDHSILILFNGETKL